MIMAWSKVVTENILDTTGAEAAAVINSFLETDKNHWRTSQDRMESVSQAIGRAIQEVCFSGLIAPSQASPGNRNIVIFPNKLKPTEILSDPGIKPIG
jgi:hypothetical protein